jgi:FtsZ-binding cell division protein ZapB
MFETVYIHFLQLAEALLSTLNKEMSVTFAALDIVNHCICTSIFLGLTDQMVAFSRVLLKFKRTFAPENGSSDMLGVSQFIGTLRRPAKSISKEGYTESWFDQLEKTNTVNALDHIALIQIIVGNVKEEVQKLGNAYDTNAAVSKIEKKAKVLEENSFFVREGDLIKINRSGGRKTYRFFLFSDTLMYAHQGFFGEYVIHTKLSLSLLTLIDVENDEKTSHYPFKINHPDKSFVVIADSPFAKYMWVKDIQQTISSCKARSKLHQQKTAVEMETIIGRIEEQVEHHKSEVRKRSLAANDRIASMRYIAQHSNSGGDIFASINIYTSELEQISSGPSTPVGSIEKRQSSQESDSGSSRLATITESGSTDTLSPPHT